MSQDSVEFIFQIKDDLDMRLSTFNYINCLLEDFLKETTRRNPEGIEFYFIKNQASLQEYCSYQEFADNTPRKDDANLAINIKLTYSKYQQRISRFNEEIQNILYDPKLDTKLEQIKEVKLTDLAMKEKIGEGGYGKVYKVQYIPTKEILALKVINNVGSYSKEAYKKLEREIKIMGETS